jgi:DNA-binding CsgD family transcriptional regulator
LEENEGGEIENQDEDLEKRLQSVNELRSLYNLHHDIWDETLLEPPFRFYYERILHPRERQVVDFKIKGNTDDEISIKMGLSPLTVQRYIYSIRYIFRNKSRQRVNKFWDVSRFFSKKNAKWRKKDE